MNWIVGFTLYVAAVTFTIAFMMGASIKDNESRKQ